MLTVIVFKLTPEMLVRVANVQYLANKSSGRTKEREKLNNSSLHSHKRYLSSPISQHNQRWGTSSTGLSHRLSLPHTRLWRQQIEEIGGMLGSLIQSVTK